MSANPPKDQTPEQLADGQAIARKSYGAPPRQGPIHTLIALRAHRKWLERGCQGDHALDDWLEAEAEVKAEIRRARAS